MERSNTASWLSSLGEGGDSSGGDDDTEDAVEEIPEQKTVTTPPKTAFNSGVKKPARPQPEWMGKLVSGRSRQSFVPSKLDQRRIELAALSEDTHLPDIQEDKDWRPQKGDLVMRKGEQCLVRKRIHKLVLAVTLLLMPRCSPYLLVSVLFEHAPDFFLLFLTMLLLMFMLLPWSDKPRGLWDVSPFTHSPYPRRA